MNKRTVNRITALVNELRELAKDNSLTIDNINWDGSVFPSVHTMDVRDVDKLQKDITVARKSENLFRISSWVNGVEFFTLLTRSEMNETAFDLPGEGAELHDVMQYTIGRVR